MQHRSSVSMSCSNESVGVFVGFSLPGAVGLGENTFMPVLWVRHWWRGISGPWLRVSVCTARSGRPTMWRVCASQTWSALCPGGRAMMIRWRMVRSTRDAHVLASS